jgi:hypothetical protein
MMLLHLQVEGSRLGAEKKALWASAAELADASEEELGPGLGSDQHI